MHAHPRIKGISVKINVFFLPILSERYPPNMHPKGVERDESEAVEKRQGRIRR